MLLGPGPSRPHQRHLGQETDWTPGLQPLQSGGVIKWALGSGDPGLNHWYCQSPSGEPELAQCLLVCSMEVMRDLPHRVEVMVRSQSWVSMDEMQQQTPTTWGLIPCSRS